MSDDVKRYDIELEQHCDKCDWIRVEREKGGYVLASEHDAAISALASRLAEAERRVRERTDLLIEAEALLCDERGGIACNELAARIRAALSPRHQGEDEHGVKEPV